MLGDWRILTAVRECVCVCVRGGTWSQFHLTTQAQQIAWVSQVPYTFRNWHFFMQLSSTICIQMISLAYYIGCLLYPISPLKLTLLYKQTDTAHPAEARSTLASNKIFFKLAEFDLINV